MNDLLDTYNQSLSSDAVYLLPATGLTLASSNWEKADSFALADSSPLAMLGNGPLLPPLADIKTLSKRIALAVAEAAVTDGVTPKRTREELEVCIEAAQWLAEYRDYERIAS